MDHLLPFTSILASFYTPRDLFTINCGSSGNSWGKDRTWTGDIDLKFLSKQEESLAARAVIQSPSAQQVPYCTARLSRSEFSYSFPVSPGKKFLRLFFYPASYPANSTNPDSYAFVNGIEIVSMYENLYFTKPNDSGFTLIGSEVMFYIPSNVALQTEYRINAGGSQISATDDTRMLPYWDADDNFLVNQYFLPADFEGVRRSLMFSKVPNYTAPEQIYRTERDMGKNKTLNMNTNLTWEFPVDSGFTYMLRLHFCELNPDINISYNRMFDIYIAVIVSGDAKPASLSLKMHPDPESKIEYSDAFLNGLKIFKVSNPNLAGPKPDLPPLSSTPNSSELPQENQRRSRSKIIIVVVFCMVASVAVLAFIVGFYLVTRGNSRDGTFKWVQFSASSSNGSNVPTELCRDFSIADIRAATSNFDELLIIGVGGFGNVYKGYIDDGQTPVAIKRRKQGSQQGLHEFRTEIEMLSQLRHNHLVSLIGYCNDVNEMILVYEFMPRGTLQEHLPWKKRLEICLSAARGLHYLHTGAIRNIIHRDVNTTNILLDDKWVAKFSDFGLSKIGPPGI